VVAEFLGTVARPISTSPLGFEAGDGFSVPKNPRHLETDNAPALWFLADSGKLMMVYSNTTDSDQIAYSFLSEIA
jgi:hypothetical protein